MTLPDARDIKRIDCLLLGEIGDAIVCTPTLQALRQQYPAARLTLIARPMVASLFAASQLADEILLFKAQTIWQKAAFLLKLRRRRCDLWVDLQAPTFNTFGSDAWIYRRNALLMRAARSRYRLGFAVTALKPQLTHAVPLPAPEVLRTENMVDTTLRLLGDTSTQARPDKQISVAAADQAWATQWWSEHHAAEERVLGLFFGAKQSAKFWPQPNIVEFISLWLAAAANHRILLLGGPHEVLQGAPVMASLPAVQASRVTNTIGATSLGQLAALMQRCAVIVSTDSGPMHIADALARPLVALMSYHNHPAIWRPVSTHATVLNHPVDCGPCLRDTCDHGNECMRRISAAEVLQRVESLLAEEA